MLTRNPRHAQRVTKMASTGEINLSEDRRPSRKGGGEARNRRPESRAGQHRAQPGRPAPRGAPASRQGGKASQGRPRTPPEPGKGARQPTAPTRSRQPAGPEIPAHISADQLDPSRRAELRTLPRASRPPMPNSPISTRSRLGDWLLGLERSVSSAESRPISPAAGPRRFPSCARLGGSPAGQATSR